MLEIVYTRRKHGELNNIVGGILAIFVEARAPQIIGCGASVRSRLLLRFVVVATIVQSAALSDGYLFCTKVFDFSDSIIIYPNRINYKLWTQTGRTSIQKIITQNSTKLSTPFASTLGP